MEGRPVLLVAKGAFHIRSLTNVSLHLCSPPVAPSIVHIDRVTFPNPKLGHMTVFP